MGMNIIIYKILTNNEIKPDDNIEILSQNEEEDGFKIFEKYSHEISEENIIDEEKCKNFGEYINSDWIDDSNENFVYIFEKNGKIIKILDRDMPYKTVKVNSVKAKRLAYVRISYGNSNFKTDKHPFDLEPPTYFENINGLNIIIEMIEKQSFICQLNKLKKHFENQDVIVKNSW